MKTTTLTRREHRERAGLTLVKAAAAANVSINAICRFEGGEGDPQLDTVTRLATAYGVSLGELAEAPTK